MKRIQQLLLLTVLSVFVTNILYAQKWDKCRGADLPGDNIYKHYTGTIGSKNVVVDLRFGYCGGSNYGCSTYYVSGKKGLTSFIIYEPDSFDYQITLHGQEQPDNHELIPPNDEKPDDRTKWPTWTFRIIGNTLTGKWNSGDGKENYDINLIENYGTSYQFDLVDFRNPESKSSVLFPRPSLKTNGEDAVFITRETQKYISGNDVPIKDWADFFRSYHDEAREYCAFIPTYNDNGFLVIEKQSYSSSAFLTSFLCLDVQRKRALVLNDIVVMNKTKLSALLESAVRKKYNLKTGKKLSTWFTSDKMPVTNNIALEDKGIVFYYTYAQFILPKAYKDKFISHDASIEIFVSYKQLEGMLKQDFKKRIGL